MKEKCTLLTCALILGLLASSCEENTKGEKLFNGRNIDNWNIYLGSSLGGEYDNISNAATPESVFSVVDHDGEKCIRISGEINGSLATRESYENYHLKMVFKWGDGVYSRRNSGLLYHSFGDFGFANNTWMPNIELQLMHENLGDTYLMANTTCLTPVIKDHHTNQYTYDPLAEVMSFGEFANGRLIRKSHDMEKPLGEWNVVELYCHGDTAVHVINGETVMINQNTGVFNDGSIGPLTSGKIQLQSEGAELWVRSIEIMPITKLPDSVMPKSTAGL